MTDGWVTLNGVVNYLREREEAERTIARLNGVVGVTNNIVIDKRSFDPDQLRKQIEYALERSLDGRSERLHVNIHDGAIILQSPVYSWREKRAVLGSLSNVPGVAEVIDHLQVDPYFQN